MRRIIPYLHRYWLPLTVASVSLACGLLVAGIGRVGQVEYELEQRAQIRFAPADLSDKVAIIEISPDDTQTFTGLGLTNVPRRYHARLIEGMKAAGAKVVIFDLRFSSIQPDTENKPFAAAVGMAAPLGVVFCEEPNATKDLKARNGYLYEFERPDFLPDDVPPNVVFGQAEPVEDGGPIFKEMSLLCLDSTTGKEVPNLPVLGFCLAHGISPEEIRPLWSRNELEVDTNVFQMDRQGGMVVDWPRAGQDFASIPYSEALAILAKHDPEHRFQNRIVFVGNTNDRQVQTVIGTERGTWVLAHQLNTMLRRDHATPRRFLAGINFGFPAALALFVALSFAGASRLVPLVVASAALIGSVGLPLSMLAGSRLMPELVAPPIVTLLATIASALARVALPTRIQAPAGAAFEATVLVADLIESTQLVRRLGSRSGGQVLDGALSISRSCIEAAGGVVIRTQGDGIVGMFLAQSVDAHATCAIRAAQQICAIRTPGSVSGETSAFRCGIESGLLHGSERNAQGLTLHVAARLEALCKVVGFRLLVGPSAFEHADPTLKLRPIGEFALKGIAEATRVYAIDPSSGT